MYLKLAPCCTFSVWLTLRKLPWKLLLTSWPIFMVKQVAFTWFEEAVCVFLPVIAPCMTQQQSLRTLWFWYSSYSVGASITAVVPGLCVCCQYKIIKTELRECTFTWLSEPCILTSHTSFKSQDYRANWCAKMGHILLLLVRAQVVPAPAINK